MKISKPGMIAAYLILFSLISCGEGNSNGPRPNVNFACDWPAKYTYDLTITDQIGRIRSIPKSAKDTIYVIDAFGASKRITSGSLLACNLPKKFEINGKAVKFSGYLLTFSSIDRTDIPGNPFELTAIELL